MKKYIDILAEIKENTKAIQALADQAAQLPRSEYEKSAALYADKEARQIIGKILRDNMRQAFIAEILPIFSGILEKYEGKPYGPRTKEKINEALKAAANCAVYLTEDSYSAEVHFVPLNAAGYSTGGYNDFTLWAGKEDKILCENKIQPGKLARLRLLNCGDYVDDVRSRAQAIQAAFADLMKARENMSELCKAYNGLLPSGIESRYAGYFKNSIVG